MKKIYVLFILFSFTILSGCSKDFLKRYDKRIVGTWRVTNVNRFGFGGSTDRLPFNNGTLNFLENGTLTFVNEANVSYQGKWEIVKKVIDETQIRSLQISAVDFSTQEILTEYYDNMNFLGTNHFSADIISTFNTYVTHFRR